MRIVAALALLLAAQILTAQSLPSATTGMLDPMERIGAWEAKSSDGVVARASIVPGHDGKALRLDWDFAKVSGYAYVRRPIAITLPDNYAISMWVRWSGGTNNLEFKLVDASGENVWWVSRPDIALKRGWQQLTFRKRDVTFAWGPTTDKVLRQAASIEFVVSRGKDGGRGSLDIDGLQLVELPEVAAILPAPTLSATGGNAMLAMDGKPGTAWDGSGPLTVDFGGARELGGVVLRWAAPPPRYAIETSADGKAWNKRRTVTGSDGGIDAIALPETETRYLRIAADGLARLAEIDIKPVDWGASDNAMIAALAKDARRGAYPRGFLEQSYWTLIGTDGGAQSGLIGEDGAIELGKGGISVEPAIAVDGKQYDWASVTPRQSLRDGYLPIPSVTWDGPGWRLVTTAFADPAGTGRILARYSLTNTGTVPIAPDLLLAVRPFQVNPPAQFLSQRGGTSAIGRIAWDGRTLRTGSAVAPATGERVTTVHLTQSPTRAALRPFAAGEAALDSAATSDVTSVSDPALLASASLRFAMPIAPGETRSVGFAAPFGRNGDAGAISLAEIDAAERVVADDWSGKLNRVRLFLPEKKRVLADTVRTSLAHILMSRDGPILRPGTRSYARSWIRDGAMISEGLLRLGQPEIVADYADWYTPYIFPNGKVPCCVDFKGADPVPENDSHGEYIFLATELYRYTGRTDGLEKYWPAILGAERYMQALRVETAKPGTPDHLRGLMPPSISHEGYSAKPQYSLWDNFWALRGYKDAAYVAEILGKPEARQLALDRDSFQSDLHRAIRAAAAHWKIDFIPGATSLGDFDATSTTMGLDPAGEQVRLDPQQLANTFDRYWSDFVARRDGKKAWVDYTPYELRNISAMIRLGRRDRIDPMLDFFFADRRPGAWNGWAEVVGRDLRETRFIGDMPHAWISSDFIRAALDMFAYERADDGALVLGAGLSDGYLLDGGSTVRGLQTPYGPLDFSIRASRTRLTVTIASGARPRGGFVLPWPWKSAPGAATVDGKSALFRDGMLSVPATGKPIRIEVAR